MLSSIPNWLRILLIILSFISFIPQLRLLWLKRDSSGISIYYVLFNLISATELATMSFFFLVNNLEGSDVFVNDPPNTGDSLNFAQLALVLVLWLVIFLACSYYPSDNRRPSLRAAWAIYVSFLFISIIPLIFDALTSNENDEDHKWGAALFHGIHSMFINPAITVLGVVAVISQVRETRSHPAGLPDSLSVVGLAVQAVVFLLLALAWPGRLVFFPWTWDELREHITVGVLITWYQLVGFVAVDNFVFALGQGIILLVVKRRGYGGESTAVDGETEPLLHR